MSLNWPSRTGLGLVGVFIAALALAPAFAGEDILPEGVDPITGLRMENYRAPTPDVLPGGKVLTDDDAIAASKGARIMIDVVAQGVLVDQTDGGIVVTAPHETIPGAIWLPGVGPGNLDEGTAAYFHDALADLTKGDKAAPLMIFCMADCWQSWNAARRAVLAGYTDVGWYPLGTDGWRDLLMDFEIVEPRPRKGT